MGKEDGKKGKTYEREKNNNKEIWMKERDS